MLVPIHLLPNMYFKKNQRLANGIGSHQLWNIMMASKIAHWVKFHPVVRSNNESLKQKPITNKKELMPTHWY
jgi:hypothetical protein